MAGFVKRVDTCRIAIDPTPWAVEQDFAREIARHWQAASAANPRMFNGQVYILKSYAVSESRLEGLVSRVSFAAYLYWRQVGCDASVLNPFGTVLVRAADGGVLFGLAGAHTLNGGRAALPGGFFDARDETDEGLIDVDRAGARELIEETGLDRRALEREAGYVIAVTERELAVGTVYRAPYKAAQLIAAAEAHAGLDPDEEMVRFAVLGGERRGGRAIPAEAGRWPVVPFAQLLLDHLDA